MALALNKIIISGTATNAAGAYVSNTTVAAVTSGNGTVVVAGLYQMSAQANISIIQYDGAAWTTVLANNTGGMFMSDGYNTAAKAINANTTATLVTVSGGQAVSGTYNS